MVTFEAGALARAYIEESGLSWPILLDKNRTLYHAYGMLDAGFWDLWGPSTWFAYLNAIMHSRLPNASSGDVRQRGGDVLIDPDGMVRLHHVGKGPTDRPRVASLLRVIERGRPVARTPS